MEVHNIAELLAGQGIWAALFVALFIYTVRKNEETVKKCEERENSLMIQLDKQNSLFLKQSELLNKLDEKLEKQAEKLSNISEDIEIIKKVGVNIEKQKSNK